MIEHLCTFALTAPVAAKKNRFRAGITKLGRLYQFQTTSVKRREASIRSEIEDRIKELPNKAALPVAGPCRVEISVDRRHTDVIGASETILDAMEKLVYLNDRQALDLHLWHTKKLPKGIYAIVRVSTFAKNEGPEPLEMPCLS